MRSVLSMLNDDVADVQRCMSELAPVAEEHNLTLWLAYGVFMREIQALVDGDITSVERYIATDRFITSLNCTFFTSQTRTIAGRSALAMGMRDEASELLTMAQQHIAETGEKYALADVYRLQAELSKVDGDIEATEQHLNTALNGRS